MLLLHGHPPPVSRKRVWGDGERTMYVEFQHPDYGQIFVLRDAFNNMEAYEFLTRIRSGDTQTWVEDKHGKVHVAFHNNQTPDSVIRKLVGLAYSA